MSPRAAWRLEAAGFAPVYDYAAGKTDWLAADLAFHGTAAARRDVHAPGRGHRRMSDDAGGGGGARRGTLRGSGRSSLLDAAGASGHGCARRARAGDAADTAVAELMRFGMSTVRPSEEVAALVHRMGHGG